MILVALIVALGFSGVLVLLVFACQEIMRIRQAVERAEQRALAHARRDVSPQGSMSTHVDLAPPAPAAVPSVFEPGRLTVVESRGPLARGNHEAQQVSGGPRPMPTKVSHS